MTIPIKELAAKWLADPEFKREYDALAPEFEALEKSIRKKKQAESSTLKPALRTPPTG